jgi:hypothetical protein
MGFYLTQVPIFYFIFFELVLTIMFSVMVSFKGYLGYFDTCPTLVFINVLRMPG